MRSSANFKYARADGILYFTKKDLNAQTKFNFYVMMTAFVLDARASLR